MRHAPDCLKLQRTVFAFVGRFTKIMGAAMVFINWWLVGETILALLMIALGVIGSTKAKNLPQRIARVGVRFLCVPIAGLGTLLGLLLLLGTTSGCESVSAPIYSPSGRIAVRVYDLDKGATGDDTSIRLFWAKGFRQAKIFSAPWEAVEPADIRWIGDSELRIEYGGGASDDVYCASSTTVVKIVCTPK